MNNEETRLSQQTIPEIFQSYSTGTFFDRCIECDRKLLEEDVPYFIEKAIKKYEGFRGYDVIFEFAICIDCAEKMREKMSRESMQKVSAYFQQHLDMNKREKLIAENPDNPELWIDECMISGAGREETNEFQLYAQCLYDRLLLPAMPYMISAAVLDKLSDMMSPKTLGEMDDFIGRHFGPPPGLEKNPRKRLPFV